MAVWKNYDAFAKPREDVRTKSALGGIITIVASIAAIALFVGQIYTYIMGFTRHSLFLSKSHWVPVPRLDDFSFNKGRMPLKIHVSFPKLGCAHLDLKHDSLSSADDKFQKIHGYRTKIEMRHMNAFEWKTVMGEADPQDMRGSCSVVAHYDVPKVGGSFSIGLTQKSWAQATSFLMFGMLQGVRAPGKKNSKKHQQQFFNVT